MDEVWRLLHLVAAAYWLGGMIVLAFVAVAAQRELEAEQFARVMARAGRMFGIGAGVAFLVIAVSGLGMAGSHLHGLGDLRSTAWGRTLEAKTAVAIAVVVLAGVHTYAGRRARSRGWRTASRVLSPVILVLTLVIFYFAVRLSEG